MKKLSIKLAAALLGGGVLFSGQIYAETIRADQYYLVSLNFTEKGYELAGTPKLLPCAIAQESNQGQNNDSIVRLFDATGKEVYSLIIVNPRVAYIESGDTPVGLLREGRLDLKLPATTKLGVLEFWEKRDQNNPSAKVELANAETVKVQCQPPTYEPRALPNSSAPQ